MVFDGLDVCELVVLSVFESLWLFLLYFPNTFQNFNILKLVLGLISSALLLIRLEFRILLSADQLNGSINISRILILISLLFSKEKNTIDHLKVKLLTVLKKVLEIDDIKLGELLHHEILQIVQELEGNLLEKATIIALNTSKVEFLDFSENPISIINNIFNINSIHFDVFEFKSETSNNELINIMTYLYKFYNFESFGIKLSEYKNFVKHIQNGYLNNPYHNSAHAADLAQFLHFVVYSCDVIRICSLNSEEIGILLISAAVHDYKHPGVTNKFLINIRDKLARVYNDQSVLENYHISSVFELVEENPNCDIFLYMDKEKKQM